MEKEAPIKVSESFLSKRFINNIGDTVLLNQEMRKVSILEFYFVGCGPCILKEKMYKEVTARINNPEYRVIYICNGEISSYEEFLEYNRKQFGSLINVIYLYDFENNIENNISGLKGYPFELILYGDQQIKQFSGFNNESYKLHFEDRLLTIKKYLNEK